MSGARRTTTKGLATEDRYIQFKNIAKRRTRARTGRRTEREQPEMERDRARRSPKNILCKVATCCTSLRKTKDKQA